MNKPKVDSKERRGVRVELRADGDGEAPKLRGHAAVFNSPSELMGGCFREIINPGAFSDALQTSDIRALVNHDSRMVLGRSSAGTLKVSEDDTGLAIEIDPPDTSYARDLIISMQRGDISEMSFAFTVAEDGQEWTRDPDESGNWTRTISKFSRIYDVSPVTYPAYPETDCALRTLETVKAKDAAPPVDGDEIVMRRLRLDLEAAS
jgi:uncharacterized protein